uniref:RING-type domain-containing protein n=1 Tax=Steinernema glaseri TaxID=37863 RepID=A0A1I7ZY95_9BILA
MRDITNSYFLILGKGECRFRYTTTFGSLEMHKLPKECLCPKCSELYNDPLILPCGHSICYRCYDERTPVCADKECRSPFGTRNKVVRNKILSGLITSLLQDELPTVKSSSFTYDCTNCKKNINVSVKVSVKAKSKEESAENRSTTEVKEKVVAKEEEVVQTSSNRIHDKAPVKLDPRKEVKETPQPPVKEESFVQPPTAPKCAENYLVFPTPPPSPERLRSEFINDQKIRKKALTDVPGIRESNVAAFGRRGIRNARMLLGYFLDNMDQNKTRFLSSLKNDFLLNDEGARTCCDAISGFSEKFVV